MAMYCRQCASPHYCDIIMGMMASQITSLTNVYSAVYSGADQRKHQSSASLAFVQGIHRSPVNSPHKWPVTRKMFPFDDVTMQLRHQPCRCWRTNYSAVSSNFQSTKQSSSISGVGLQGLWSTTNSIDNILGRCVVGEQPLPDPFITMTS